MAFKNKNFSCWLHFCAGIILLTFAGSHFGFLFLPDATHHLKNIVFPFLSNWTLYLVAGLTEAIVGVLCLNMCGRNLTNVIILTFVFIMFWYRWAFNYLGGTYCGCTGLLGRLFHLSKHEEIIVPILTLGALTFTAIPWLYSVLKKVLSFSSRLIVIFLVLLVCQNVFSEDKIHIEGTIDWQDYAPGTGQPTPQYHAHHKFAATISGDGWKLCVTNINRPRWWAEIVYDGTNTYVIQPESKYGFLAKGADQIPLTNSQTAMIENSPGFPHALDEMNATIGWFTYGLSPRTVRTNRAGLIDMPTPTTSARDNLRSYGYKWLIEFTEDGRFVSHCEIVRDKTLDLSDNEELLRPEFDYPETLQDYNEDLMTLGLRRATPDGFIKNRYITTEWFHTNGLTIPLASKLEGYWWDPKNGALPHPWHIFDLRATSITLSKGDENVLPEITMPTQVQDYRYKKANESRIFKYAQYKLGAGDFWKSDNDPTILAQVGDYLKHGRKYATYANNEKHWVAWLLLVTTLAPLVILSIVYLKNKPKKQNK